MLVKSFIVFPDTGKAHIVLEKLSKVAGCEVHPAVNSDLLVLAMESRNDAEETQKEKTIEAIAEIKSMTLVFGSSDLCRLDQNSAEFNHE